MGNCKVLLYFFYEKKLRNAVEQIKGEVKDETFSCSWTVALKRCDRNVINVAVVRIRYRVLTEC
jgi:hypothetical protein